jgi:hypothetical protein
MAKNIHAQALGRLGGASKSAKKRAAARRALSKNRLKRWPKKAA